MYAPQSQERMLLPPMERRPKRQVFRQSGLKRQGKQFNP
jgi:hypothetical protein